MPNIDIHARLTSIVAQELEASADADGIGYLVVIETFEMVSGPDTLEGPVSSVFLDWHGRNAYRKIGLFGSDHHTRRAVRMALDDLGILKDKVKA